MLSSLTSGIAGLSGSDAAMLMLVAKATVILLGAVALTVAMQKSSAGSRHLVWLVTLGTLLLVPALAAWSPLRVAVLPAPAVVQSAEAPAGVLASDGRATRTTPPGPLFGSDAGSTVPGQPGPLSRLSGVSLALALWAGVLLVLAGWLAYGALAVRRIVRNAEPLDTQDWLTPLWETADRLELEEPPRLLGSSEAKMPFACGFLTPTIVLPADCDTWTPDRRRAVLLHELAHVKRRDLAGHTLGRIACAVYWFHPLVWTAAKQLRSESERACDDLALACGARASDYAEHLLDIVTSVRHDATPAVALAMARRKEFEGRMLAILDPELRRSSPDKRQSSMLAASLAALAILIGAAAPVPRASAIVVTSSVPVATESPAIDRDFMPRDVAEPLSPGKKDVKREQTAVETREKETPTVESKTASAAATAVERAEATVEGAAARALVQLGAEGVEFKRSTAPDERPGLLANILRTDKDPQLRKLAAWGLSEYAENQVAMEALAQALRRDADASVREMAAWALADGRDNGIAVTALTEALRGDASEKVRGIAAWSLGNLGARDAVPALTAALNDANKGVRTRAIWALGHIGPKEAPAALVAGLRDSQPMVRQLTAWALYQIEDPGTIGALNAALQAETNAELRINYIQALAALGEKSVEAIRGLLLSSDPKIKSMAVRALAGGHGAGPWPWPWPEPRPFP